MISNVDLETFDITTPALRALEKKKGVYFWMMRYAGARYKIYVGKTNSLARRVREYRSKFQPGVPNDYKMRHVQSWARSKFQDAEFDLYFFEADDNTARETEIWRRTKPLLNERMGASAKALQDAHWEYYQSGLERILAEESPPALGARTTVAAVAVNPNASTKPRPVRSTKGPAAGTAIARARDKFAESGTFKLGTNRAFIYDLLSRDGGATLDECRHACLNPHRTSSIVTDLYDVAAITQRKLVKGMHDGAERYWLEK